MIWWPRKTNETNHFKVKIWRGFDLAILKVKQIHYKRIEVFTIKFNPKSIATSNSNLLTWPHASSESTDSFSSWIYSNTSTHACDFEIPLKSFRPPSLINLVCNNFYNPGYWDSSRNIASRRLWRGLGTKTLDLQLEAQDALFSL